MTIDLYTFYYGFLSLTVTVLFFVAYMRSMDYAAADTGTDAGSGKGYHKILPRHRTILIPGALIPVLLFSLLLSMLLNGLLPGAGWMLSKAFVIFVSMIVYEVFLLMTMPFFRKHFSSDVCASLWTLPEILYFALYIFYQVPAPLLVIPLNGRILIAVAVIWSAGFVIMFTEKVISHLTFRKQLLEEARKVDDPEVLKILENLIFDAENMQHGSHVRKGILGGWNRNARLWKTRPISPQLYISPATTTPLTIGISRKTTVIVLPESSCSLYEPEDFRLVLLHELGHIYAKDCRSKFFMTLYTSLFWFLPIHRLAMKEMAGDMEVACDEAVLNYENEAVRYRYVNLLLHRPGDNRGFTSCLSATGQSLKNRMQKVLHPKKYNRLAGGLLLAAFTFLLVNTCGYIRISPETKTAAEFAFGHAVTAEELISLEETYDPDHSGHITDWNELADYLNNLQAYELLGTVRDSMGGSRAVIADVTPVSGDSENVTYVDFHNNIMEIVQSSVHVSIDEESGETYRLTDDSTIEYHTYYYIADNNWNTILPEEW